ncbi:hypothetical protein JXB41_03105 [Candidatus Woesearchaeota archaeon]|nr:hypothetical protein [Candidatus Woesearchaeota archaeon]
MKELNYIEDKIKKIQLLSDLYKDILNKDISTKEELDITRTKARVAKQEILKLIYEMHKVLEKIQFYS